MTTYYASELPGLIQDHLVQKLGDVPHDIISAKSLDLCGGQVILVKYASCECHTGPVTAAEYSPSDLITIGA